MKLGHSDQIGSNLHNKWVWFFAIMGVGGVLTALAFGLLPLFTEKAGWLIVGITIGLSAMALPLPLVHFRDSRKTPSPHEQAVIVPHKEQLETLQQRVRELEVGIPEAEGLIQQWRLDAQGAHQANFPSLVAEYLSESKQWAVILKQRQEQLKEAQEEISRLTS